MSQKFLDIKDDNQFALSTGDLMAALLLIFALLLVGTMLKLQEEFDSKSDVAERYKELQIELYNDLYDEFKMDLPEWHAELDSTLTIRFKEPNVMFDGGSSIVKEEFKRRLTSFFPRYIKVLMRNKYKEHIEEIRIEGHTSYEGRVGMSPEGAYFYNMQLSQDRTRSVLRFCLKLLEQNVYEWTRDRSTANGLSSVKPLASNETEDGRIQNRRVEFRIKTDAEAQIREMLRYATK
ncbi:OmpA family protein [Mangrovibacterium diazotrophicum]|uniref:Outer membrane protein OmpA-like peptidoglycan-associated protein n=1 Tax=Mangrovibacterium diazotrophicum TaxID=1261403 RepID=A0A419W3J3_9BACT|nr:OmpA family protein [Mangrovibacterium diazotrophicum]RKD90045.1 outer membrane protein OmpA-like peptidoglycan-associated protein [Mangrovibacterium diazotrophicum]